MKISVLTPAFQSGPYLERAIESVLRQNDNDFEHIIVDGGSTDGTVEILRKFDHLRWISEPDKGQSDAMNKAFAMSTGQIIAYLNADDWYETGAFAHIRGMFEANPGAQIVVGNLYTRYENRDSVELVVPVKNYKQILLHFRYRYPLNPVSYFYLRSVQDAVGKFPDSLHYAMDYWFLLRAFSQSKIVETGMVLGTFFQNGFNKTSVGSILETPSRIVLSHMKESNPWALIYYYRNWLWCHYVREFTERVKSPFRCCVYWLFFSRKMSRRDYQLLGFRKAWNSHGIGRLK